MGLAPYDRYRSELEHEDTLINHRLSWFLAAQSLLFAAVGVALQKDLTPLAVTVMSVGFLSSVFILVSISAAIRTFYHWLEQIEKLKQGGAADKDYPQLNRPSALTTRLGFSAPALLPIVFGLAWLSLACACIVSWRCG